MAEISEQPKPKKLNTKAIATEIALWILAPSYGGITQFFSERPTAVVDGKDMAKFPDGINFKEEFLEGALPVVAGMVAGKLFYHWSVAKFGAKRDPLIEKYCMIGGGFLGYVSMMALGAVLHEITGSPDVKLLPLK